MAIRLLTPTGIEVSGSIGVAISDCRVTGLDVRTDSSAGNFLLDTIEATVRNSTVDGLVNNDGAAIGFSCINCVEVTTANCVAQNITTHFNS